MSKFVSRIALGPALALSFTAPAVAGTPFNTVQADMPKGNPQTSAADAAVQAKHQACFDTALKSQPQNGKTAAALATRQYDASLGNVTCMVRHDYSDGTYEKLAQIKMYSRDGEQNSTEVNGGRMSNGQIYLQRREIFANNSAAMHVNDMYGNVDKAKFWSDDQDRTTGFFSRIQQSFDFMQNKIGMGKRIEPPTVNGGHRKLDINRNSFRPR